MKKSLTTKLLTIAALLVPLAYSPLALAQVEHNKANECGRQADKQNLKGDERKAYIWKCMEGKDVEERSSGTQERAKAEEKKCDADAGGKEGADHAKHMKACLKK